MALTKDLITNKCNEFWALVTNQNGLVENLDGSLSVYLTDSNGIKSPIQITKQCCDVLAIISGKNYYFDLDGQKCRWSETKDCEIIQPFNIVLNPLGNDGTIFYNQNDEQCLLNINFDYLVNFDCSKIFDLIIKEKKLNSNPEYIEILTLKEQINQLTVECDNITSNITYLTQTINSSYYSINCSNFPIVSTQDPQLSTIVLSEKEKIPFTKTGFGGLAPLSFPSMPLYRSVNFCINEPNGLNVWANILGPLNYQLFLEGDSNSYSCKNVIDFYNQNLDNLSINQTDTPYLFECDTPFGFKSDLVTQLNSLISKQKKCQSVIQELTIKSNQLITNFGDLMSKCSSPIALFENIDLSVTLDIINEDGTLTTVFEENFFKKIGQDNFYVYLLNNLNSGFYVNGFSNTANDFVPLIFSNLNKQFLPESNVLDVDNNSTCSKQVQEYLLNELFIQSGLNEQQNGMSIFLESLSPNILASNWLNYNFTVEDETILSLIKDKKIKLSIKVNDTCGDFCLMLDNIKLNKNCLDSDQKTLYIQESPGFSLTKIVDNKKSWLNNDNLINRTFDIETVFGDNPIRQTNYKVLDERLVINSKEIDLNINIAKAVEHDVWYYISNNECLITGDTLCYPCFELNNKNFQDNECFDFQDNQPYDYMDTFDGLNNANTLCCGDNKIAFDSLTSTNLLEITNIDDFKKVLISELIDVKNRKTINSYATLKALYERYLNSLDWCDSKSSEFNYYTIEQFANLIGDYWVDLIEQVIPATTLWGSVKIYTNTLFDQQKFKYREYTSLLCENPFKDINVVSPVQTCDCQDIEVISTTITIDNQNDFKIGNVTNICNNLCIVQLNSGSEFIGTVNIMGGDGDLEEESPIDCLLSDWSDWSECSCGRQNRTRSILINPQNGGKECGITYEERSCSIDTKTCWYNMQERPEIMMLVTSGLYFESGTTLTVESVKVNGQNLLNSPIELYLDANNINWIPANNDVIYGSVPGGVTGWTYTNFVDLINSAFTQCNLCDYVAEIDINARENPDNPLDYKDGFTITYPIGDTFEIKTTSSINTPNYYLTYTENDLIYNSSYNYWMTCNI